MTQDVIRKKVLPLLQSEFNMSETMRVLTHNPNIYYSWGVSGKWNIQNKGLLLRVNGNHHKGDVLITLGWDDTYTVHIMSNRGRVISSHRMVYFDQLVEIIDCKIEKMDYYTN